MGRAEAISGDTEESTTGMLLQTVLFGEVLVDLETNYASNWCVA
jgi:hypothetical protein